MWQGKALVLKLFNQTFAPSAHISDLHYRFPFRFIASHVRMANLGEADRIDMTLSPFSLLRGVVHMTECEIINPRVTVRSPIPENTVGGDQPAGKEEGVKVLPSGKQFFAARIDQLKIRNGTLTILIPNQGDMEMNSIQGRINGIRLPLADHDWDFSLVGRIGGGYPFLAGNKFQLGGWFNWPKKNLEARGVVFQNEEKSLLTWDAVSRNNALDVKGHVVFTPSLTGDQKLSPEIQELLFGSASSNQTSVDADFAFQTQMDHPQINKITFKGLINQASNENEPISKVLPE